MKAARRDPFKGIGKPEPLKHLGADIWSRRITARDRLVYRVTHEFIDSSRRGTTTAVLLLTMAGATESDGWVG